MWGDIVERRRVFYALAAAFVLVMALGLSAAADWDLFAGDSARVAYTGGEGVNLRAAPGDGEVIARLPEDFPVVIQDAVTLDDGTYWYSVSADLASGWTTGWVIADFLTDDPALNTFVYEGYEAASGVPIAVNASDGVYLRANPWSGADVLTTVPSGAWVDVRAPSVYDDAGVAWSYVRWAGMEGYVASAFLGYHYFGGGAAWSGSLAIGEVAVVSGTGGDGVNLRSDAGIWGAALAILPEGAAGEVIDGPLYDDVGDAWYMLATEYGTGWAHGGYLVSVDSAALASGSASAAGAQLASLSMDYLGIPYVWAGVTPNGFDCSGFTYYLINQVLGYDFSRIIDEQMASGYEVGADQLQPGDLIFFQNTYTWGLSHVGIYIGNGQMVSASGEHMAVGINDLNDPYWASRYLTARRVV